MSGIFGIPWDRCVALLVHLHVKQMLSAAVRLNVVGPFQSTSLLYGLRDQVGRLVAAHLARAAERGGEAAGDLAQSSYQSSPLADLAQSLHGQLYSRLFQS